MAKDIQDPPYPPIIEVTMDKLGNVIKSQLQLMQDADDGNLAATFNALAKMDIEGARLLDSLKQDMRYESTGAPKSPVEEIAEMVRLASREGYRSYALGEVLPDIEAVSKLLDRQPPTAETTIRVTRDYMNKAHPKV